MAMGRTVQPVDRLRGDAERGIVAEADIGLGHVIVDRLWEGNHVQPMLHQVVGILLRPATPQANQRGQVVSAVIVDNNVGHIPHRAGNGHGVGLVATGAQNGSSLRDYARERCRIQQLGPVFHQAAKAVAKADHLHAITSQEGLADPPDSCIESRAVTSGSQNPDHLAHGFCPFCYPLEPESGTTRQHLHDTHSTASAV